MSARIQRRVVVLTGFSEPRASQLDVALAAYGCLRVRIDTVTEVGGFCSGGVHCDAVLMANEALADALLAWWAAAPRGSPCPLMLHDSGEAPETVVGRLIRLWEPWGPRV